ncbi:hypothetical protein HPB50_015515 [Hyalomma asiaticum]|uniref:Uncharacterized protein n=1 Tax=Hyalomma asiaticum TaxID=266040 RepID=A0ACB7SNL2_HYAAI|nr:hypothetical protein HPB50_015515 [Hyalomma asiaticum]
MQQEIVSAREVNRSTLPRGAVTDPNPFMAAGQIRGFSHVVVHGLKGLTNILCVNLTDYLGDNSSTLGKQQKGGIRVWHACSVNEETLFLRLSPSATLKGSVQDYLVFMIHIVSPVNARQGKSNNFQHCCWGAFSDIIFAIASRVGFSLYSSDFLQFEQALTLLPRQKPGGPRSSGSEELYRSRHQPKLLLGLDYRSPVNLL